MKLLGGSIFHLKECLLRKISQPNKQLGGWVGGWGRETTQKKKRVIAGRFFSAQKQRLQASKQIRY
jgi:hypothetical protein